MRRTAVERGKDADNAPLLLGGQGRGRARYLNYWVVMAVIGQGTSLSVRQSFKVKPVHCAHRTRTANPVIPSKKNIRGLCCNLFRTINSPWVSLMWR